MNIKCINVNYKRNYTDLKGVQKKLHADEAFLESIIEIFLDDFPSKVTELKSAVDKKDSEQSKMIVHRLGSSLGMICKNEVTVLIEEIENSIKARGLNKKALNRIDKLFFISECVINEVNLFKNSLIAS